MNMTTSQCIYCGTSILVNQLDYNDMDAHICTVCYPMRRPFSTSQPDIDDFDSDESSDEFDLASELEELFINEELELADLTEEEILEQLSRDIKEMEKARVKCECGAAAVRSPLHSNWCPKHSSKKRAVND